ncbi:MAG: methyltransferase domain-containing protein [Candidatus Omnitrophota bacterium]|nr:MAG: methyltransferase domain-containing protein [Candidatus Omnitrophota bacterium]
MLKATFQLERWEGDFGKEYTDRNALSPDGLEKLYKDHYGITRTELNNLFLQGMERSLRILEVGSNVGNQLLCLQKMGFNNLYGIEPQDYAVELSKRRTEHINIIRGSAFDIPFKDGYFDLVFTSGVLIHINPKDIGRALREISRCSNKYIWGLEYYAEKYEEIVYRGEKNLLWKTDFAKLYQETLPAFELVKEQKFKYLSNDKITTGFLLKKKDKPEI